MRKLNLGCGKDYRKGWVNLDVSRGVKADIYSDLEKRLPFKDNYFDKVIANDVIEHVKNPLFFVEEVYRVLKHNGIFEFKTPYGAHVNSFFIGHKSFLAPKSFEPFLIGTRRFYVYDYECKAKFKKDFFKVKFIFLNFWFPEIFQYINIFIDVVASFKGRFITLKEKKKLNEDTRKYSYK